MFKINKIKNIYLIKKESLTLLLFYSGMVIAYFGSLNPWFMWFLSSYYIIISAMLLVMAMIISSTMSNTLFSKKTFIIPTTVYFVLLTYQAVTKNNNINSYIVNIFSTIILLSLFRINKEAAIKVSTIISKIMAVLLIVSIFGYIQYLMGIYMPSQSVSFKDGLYTYTNYYLFLLDDRSLFTLIPRFHSVFLEPGQMGTATVYLLLTQYGKWKKWYNVVLLTATFISFSLAAYVMLVFVIFFNLWIQGKDIARKVILAISVIAAVTMGAFLYNGGDNLLHDLILLRLEVEDGDIVGNNRTREGFSAEFETFLTSSDVFLGKEYDEGFGNSGYKVFIYQNGIIGTIILLMFYITSTSGTTYVRAVISGLILSFLNFIVRGFPLWYCFFIPIYSIFMIDNPKKEIEDCD